MDLTTNSKIRARPIASFQPLQPRSSSSQNSEDSFSQPVPASEEAALASNLPPFGLEEGESQIMSWILQEGGEGDVELLEDKKKNLSQSQEAAAPDKVKSQMSFDASISFDQNGRLENGSQRHLEKEVSLEEGSAKAASDQTPAEVPALAPQEVQENQEEKLNQAIFGFSGEKQSSSKSSSPSQPQWSISQKGELQLVEATPGDASVGSSSSGEEGETRGKRQKKKSTKRPVPEFSDSEDENEKSISMMNTTIDFFFENDTKNNHIYAHLQFTSTARSGEKSTSIRSRFDIMRTLRDESIQMKIFMKQMYDIDLYLHPELGYIHNLDMKGKWFKGELYGFFCRHYYAYTEILKMFAVQNGQMKQGGSSSVQYADHPEEIYRLPEYGHFYYLKGVHLQFFGFPRRSSPIEESECSKQEVKGSNKFKKFKWKKTNFKTKLPKHKPVVIYVTANTKNIEGHKCMMHAGSLYQGKFTELIVCCAEFDYEVYTQRGHGQMLRKNNTKLTYEDETANLEVHERIVFCHIRQMRKNTEDGEDSGDEGVSKPVSSPERIPTPGPVRAPPARRQAKRTDYEEESPYTSKALPLPSEKKTLRRRGRPQMQSPEGSKKRRTSSRASMVRPRRGLGSKSSSIIDWDDEDESNSTMKIIATPERAEVEQAIDEEIQEASSEEGKANQSSQQEEQVEQDDSPQQEQEEVLIIDANDMSPKPDENKLNPESSAKDQKKKAGNGFFLGFQSDGEASNNPAEDSSSSSDKGSDDEKDEFGVQSDQENASVNEQNQASQVDAPDETPPLSQNSDHPSNYDFKVQMQAVSIGNNKVIYHEPETQMEEEYKPSKKVVSATKKIRTSSLKTRQSRAQRSDSVKSPNPKKSEASKSQVKKPVPFSKREQIEVFCAPRPKIAPFNMPQQYPQPFQQQQQQQQAMRQQFLQNQYQQYQQHQHQLYQQQMSAQQQAHRLPSYVPQPSKMTPPKLPFDPTDEEPEGPFNLFINTEAAIDLESENSIIPEELDIMSQLGPLTKSSPPKTSMRNSLNGTPTQQLLAQQDSFKTGSRMRKMALAQLESKPSTPHAQQDPLAQLEEWWKRRDFVNSQVENQLQMTLQITERIKNQGQAILSGIEDGVTFEGFNKMVETKQNLLEDLFMLRDQMKEKYKKWKNKTIIKEQFYRQKISEINHGLKKISMLSIGEHK